MEMNYYNPITNTFIPEHLRDKTYQDINHSILELDYIGYELRLVVDSLDTMLVANEDGEIKYGALRVADDFLTARVERLTEVLGNLKKLVNIGES